MRHSFLCWSLLIIVLQSLSPSGFAEDAAHPRAFVTNQGSHDVSVIDLILGKEIARIPVAQSPAGVAVDDVHGRVWVTSPDGRMLTQIDAQSLTVRATQEVGGPVGIALDPLGEKIYVSDWYDHQLIVLKTQIETQKLTILNRIPVGHVPAGIVISPDGDRLYLAERDDNQIAVFDTHSFNRIASIPVGQHPFGLALDATGKTLVAVNVKSNDVSLIDTGALIERVKIPVGISPYCAVFSDDGRLFITNQHSDSVSVIDVASAQLSQTLMVGAFPEGIDIFHNQLFVVSWMDEELDVIDLVNLKMIRRIPLGKNSRGFGHFISSNFPPSN